jgi:hypothetical protein
VFCCRTRRSTFWTCALTVEPFPLMNETAKFDVNLSLRESPDA